jgi:hypothetical protein
MATNEFWTLDIEDANGNKIISGITLVYGIDLLEQYPHLNFGGQLILRNEGTETKLGPTYESLGVEDNLYFIPV